MDLEKYLRKFRDRLRIIIILYTFCERLEGDYYGVFRTEIKIQALDFLLRYPDFLSMELMELMDNDNSINRNEIKNIVKEIYLNKEPEIRVEEMEKFFHGAYESIDDVIAFLVSVGFLKHESKRRTDGKTYDRYYYITEECSNKIIENLRDIPVVTWYFNRCELIKKYFNQFTGTELKTRQYKYNEYSNISYRGYIENINEKVKSAFYERFNHQLL
ncbi:hypothetical protein R5O20_03110 [Tenacibaculum maritimum]|uniref:hypothetical protein n=1 Tax=Tenacibaculum maritimum TaxID=107401 RepID=UPI00387677EA